MRLPRPTGQSLLLHIVSAALLCISATLTPLSAHASALPLAISPSGLKFGTVPVGQSETQLTVLTNTGTTSATLSAIDLGDPAFSISGLNLPTVLAAGQKIALNVTFAPTANGRIRSTATFTINGSNSNLQLPLAGAGVTRSYVIATPPRLSFGHVAAGATVTLPVVLTNPGTSDATLKGLQAVGTGFSVSGLVLPLTLKAGQKVTMNVSFAPQSAGIAGGSVLISGPALNVPLRGTATVSTAGLLTISPSTLNFGRVPIGAIGTQTATLGASGASVTISSVASSSSQFYLPGVSFPLTIAAGQTEQLNVSFKPNGVGTTSATLSFASNASNSQASESLAGTGTTPQVSLSWTASTSDVSGYNVYRGTTPGVYSKINTALDPTTTYTDRSVASGTTYYYAATAVDSSGQESTYSTPVQVVVP